MTASIKNLSEKLFDREMKKNIEQARALTLELDKLHEKIDVLMNPVAHQVMSEIRRLEEKKVTPDAKQMLARILSMPMGFHRTEMLVALIAHVGKEVMTNPAASPST